MVQGTQTIGQNEGCITTFGFPLLTRSHRGRAFAFPQSSHPVRAVWSGVSW